MVFVNKWHKGSLFIFTILFVWFALDSSVGEASESDYQYIERGDGVEITKYKGDEKEVIIPDTLGGKQVIRIGHDAFFNKQLTSVTIPETVIEIGSSAFSDNNLTEITIPNSVREINSSAFYRNQLTSVKIGSQLTGIAGNAFSNNPLAMIHVNQDNEHFQDIDGKGLYTADGTLLVVGTTSGEITIDTLEIGSYAFEGRGLTSIDLPSRVEKIGKYAFRNNKLVRLTIPESVTHIGFYSFANNLLEVLYIGGNVEVIEGSAFRDNRLTEVEIPNKVKTLEGAVFIDNLLTHVKIGSSVESFSGLVFNGNPIENIELASENPNFQLVENGQALYSSNGETLIVGTTSGVILEGTITIDNSAFEGRQLETISIPDSVQTIGSYAFRNNRLTKVSIPDGVTSIEQSAFKNNPQLVLSGSCGTEAEKYANNNDIPFLSNCNPLVGQFRQSGTDNHLVAEANTEVYVYSYDDLETEQYYIWTNDNSLPPFEENTWTEFMSGETISKAEDGEWFLHIEIIDSNDNSLTLSSNMYRIDASPPVIYFEQNGSGQVSKNVTTKVTVTDEGSGVDASSLQYIWSKNTTTPSSEEAWKSFTNGDEIYFEDENGTWYLHVKAKDNLGNSTSKRTNAFVLDNVSPSIEVKLTYGDDDKTYQNNTWINENVNVSVTATDEHMKELRIKINDEAVENITGYTHQFTITKSGIYKLKMTAIDEAGNETTVERTVKMDRSAPKLTLLGANPMQISYGEAFVDPGYEVTDNLDNQVKEKVVIEGVVDPLKPGIYKLTYRVKDEAGNETIAERAVNVGGIPEIIKFKLSQSPVPVYPGTTIILDGSATSIQLPADLPVGTTLQIEPVENIDFDAFKFKQVGEIYRFIFTYPKGYENYEGEFILTMGIDEEVEHTAIYYYDESNGSWKYVGGDIDKRTITSTVNHFSVYGVLAEAATDVNGGNEEDDEAEGEVIIDTRAEQEKKQNKLPITASGLYDVLLWGATFIILGVVIWLISSRRKDKFKAE